MHKPSRPLLPCGLAALLVLAPSWPQAQHTADEPLALSPLAADCRPALAGEAQGPDCPLPARSACPHLPLPAGAPCALVSDSRLDTLRGGFDTGTGLRISFGIERVTFINGQLVAHTALHLPDLSSIAPDQAAMLGNTLGRLQVIQNGPGNVFNSSQFPTTAAGTVIQNTLNDQIIKQLTTLSTTTNSLQFLRSSNALTVLRDALTGP